MGVTLQYRSKVVPTVTAAQMAWVDDKMMQTYHVGLLQMMENAGMALAALAVARMHRRLDPVVVMAGPGGNGGGGLAAARRLAAWGWPVKVVLAQPDLRGAVQIQRDILDRMAVPITNAMDVPAILTGSGLVIDALLGYGITGAPRAGAKTLIRAANASGVAVLALDVPSGLHPDTGIPANPTIYASATLTLAMPKAGLAASTAQAVVGAQYLADIGVPHRLYAHLGLSIPELFHGEPYVALLSKLAD